MLTDAPASLRDFWAGESRAAFAAVPAAAWAALDGAAILVAGGTGFVGRWLLHTLLHARRREGVNLRLTVISRDPRRLAADCPGLPGPGLDFIHADLRDLHDPQYLGHTAAHSHAIHAGLSIAPADSDMPARARESTLRLAAACGASGVRRLLHVSSGAVYGITDGPTPETQPLAHDAHGPYAQAKLAEESVLAASDGFDVVTARCYSFIGAGLPVGAGLAAADFIDAAARGQALSLASDGSATRSYLYAGEMAAWLVALLAVGRHRWPYHVGSSQPVTIGELAGAVRRVAGLTDPVTFGPGRGATPGTSRGGNCYVPQVHRITADTGLQQRISLDDAIARHLAWARTALT